MQNNWQKSAYQIQMHQGAKIFSQTVYGFTKSGFGIHESDAGWNVTHVASGWNCFTAESEKGAVILADYLRENFREDFERLKVSGTELENYKPLLKKIKDDPELKELVRLFGTQSDQPGKDGQREIGVKIIS